MSSTVYVAYMVAEDGRDVCHVHTLGGNQSASPSTAVVTTTVAEAIHLEIFKFTIHKGKT
jgi:hypothetical protein